mgnify:CR=1 FL=1|jgi:nicotinamide-nucleotide adenylyltransferase
MTIGLFIGRFQPFHNGHLAVIKKILEKHDSVIIVIGSSQEHDTAVNPFSAEERRKMIELALTVECIENYQIVDVPDINDNARWVGYVSDKIIASSDDLESSNPFDIVYCGAELTRDLFEKEDYKVEWIDERIGGISASEIRLRISKDMDWEEMVPKKIVEYIKDIKGVERVKSL